MPIAGKHILARLHELRVEIEQRMLRDPSFRSLCEDHGVAVQARGFWKQSARNDAAERAREYKALMIDLEKEILREIGHGDDA
jgi:hypothetical protein